MPPIQKLTHNQFEVGSLLISVASSGLEIVEMQVRRKNITRKEEAETSKEEFEVDDVPSRGIANVSSGNGGIGVVESRSGTMLSMTRVNECEIELIQSLSPTNESIGRLPDVEAESSELNAA